MVAVIRAGKSIKTTLAYNEEKVKREVAELIHAAGYAKDMDQLHFLDKLRRLERLAALNQRTKVNSLHVSLNFDPSEQLDRTTLIDIASYYMGKIGFAGQPYLVYQHHDAGHPHIHIVSTNIRRDGTRISLHNIGRNQSEKARKEIELAFRLVQAESKSQKQSYKLEAISAERIQYGKSETKRAITNVLNLVLPNYKYTSLPELNAVLKGYNVAADQGNKNSRIYKSGGLVYRVLDANGKKVGVPIKASEINNKPTLTFLTQRFMQNEERRQPHKARIKNHIDLYFVKSRVPSIDGLTSALQKESIQPVLRQNEQGLIYGVTYVDHRTKCVFNGSDLGKPYSANAIQERCRQIVSSNEQLPPRQTVTQENVPIQSGQYEIEVNLNLLHGLMKTESEGSGPVELKEDKKRKRKSKRVNH